MQQCKKVESQSGLNNQCKETTSQTKVQPLSNSLPSFVYYTFVNCSSLKKYLAQLKQEVKKQILQDEDLKTLISDQTLEQQKETNLHLSLSKILPLYKKQSELLHASLKKQLCNSQFNLMIPLSFTNITVLSNQYIALVVDQGICFDKLKAVTNRIDTVLKKWNFQGYYKDPVFHVTLFKLNLETKGEEIGVDKKNNEELGNKKLMETLLSKLERMKVKRMYFNCKQICFKVGIRVHKLA